MLEKALGLKFLKKMEELVCNTTAQEQKESVIKEEKAKEEFGGQYKELLTRQSFLCLGPIYENLIQDVFNEAVTETLDEDETVQKLKISHRIKEKQNKDTSFQSLSKETGRKWSNLNRYSFSDSEENCTPKSMKLELEHEFISLKMKHKWNRIVSPCSSKSNTTVVKVSLWMTFP